MTRLEALADPVRLTLARHLAVRPGASAPEIAAAIGVHLNTARAHLAPLIRAGAVERSSESSGRPGRPVIRYRLRGEWLPSGDELLPLAQLMGSAVLRHRRDSGKLRALAREWGRRWSAERAEVPVETRLSTALERLSFRATVSGERLELSGCPCPDVMPNAPGALCAVANGVADGVLAGSAVRAQRWEHDPKVRRCTAALSTT
jgi:predicted ArsR family transcriptional regulator